MLLYNKSLFRKAGLDPNKPPTNWAQIKADALKIRALGNGIYGYNIPGACGGCLVFTLSPLIWASGGDILTTFGANQKTTWSTSPAVADTFAFYRDLWNAGVVAPQDRTQDGSSWDALFYAGKVGIWLGCGCEAAGAQKAGVDVGVAPIPGKNGNFSTFEGGDILGIPQGSSHADQAWQVIEWLLSPEAQLVMATVPDPVALVPVRLDMATPQFKAKYPFQAITLYAATKGRTPKAIGFNAAFEDPSAPWVQAFPRNVFSGADLHSTLATADKAATALLKQAWQSTVGR
jgi:multiple sugar transport system substrate-binding protein